MPTFLDPIPDLNHSPGRMAGPVTWNFKLAQILLPSALLLALPTEIIVRALTFLGLADLNTCRRVNQFLFNLIHSSVELRYRMCLLAEGMEDNPFCPLPISDRLSLLLQRQNAWLNFVYSSRASVEIPHTTSGPYDLKNEAYVMGKALHKSDVRSVQRARLPRTKEEQVRWSEIAIGKLIINFGSAIDEHNLIAFVTK
jgi:hypothetical protein